MKYLNDEELSNYAVCPESWRLKFITNPENHQHTPSESVQMRKEWTANAELQQRLTRYTKVVFALLAILTGGILLLDSFGLTQKIMNKAGKDELYSFSVPTEIGMLLLVVGLLIFIWDLLDRRATTMQKASGLAKNSELLSAKGSSMLPAMTLVSKKQKLRSKPYAVIKEDKHILPVDMYPMTNKVRDRHVLSLLLHLYLIEADSGKRPPYGVLLMGKKRKRVQIANSDEKQRWLRSVLAEMRSIEEGIPAVPSPSKRKCEHCDVESRCEHSALKSSQDVRD